jgi:tetratricopeptide (TPR) repeat protein
MAGAAPYAAAFTRYVSACERRDYAEAIRALDEAVACEPETVEPYERRGRLWRLLGDYVRASGDYATCLALDAHWRDRDSIRSAAGLLRDAYVTTPAEDGRWDPSACRSQDLRTLLQTRAVQAARRRAVLERPSCDLPCPSRCCYFEDETFVYGVHLDAQELAAAREYLRAADLPEGDYLARVERHRCPQCLQARDAWFVTAEDGREYMYYPRRGSRVPGADDGPPPRNSDYLNLRWLTRRSRACMFLGETGCAVHDVGVPPGLATCRHFLCLTAFVFLIAGDVGLASKEDLASRSMRDLSEAALAVLPMLAAGLGSVDARAAQADVRDALAAAVAADQAGDEEAVRAALARHADGERAGADVRAGAWHAARDVMQFGNPRRPR